MNTREITQQYRFNQWTKLIQECHDSGKTVTAWCLEHELNTKSYYCCLRKLRAEASKNLPAVKENVSTVPLDLSEISHSNNDVAVYSPSNLPADVIIRIGSAVIEIKNTAAAGLIENVLKVLYNDR